MTDNGPDKFDEINLVENKFNGGWAKIIGNINDAQLPPISPYEDFVYSDPEFSWELPIGITALDFARWVSYLVNMMAGYLLQIAIMGTFTS